MRGPPRQLKIAGAALLLLSLQLTGAAQPAEPAAAAPRYGGVLRAGMQTDPIGLDPHTTNSTATRNMLENVYDTLVAFAADGRIVPSLAARWSVSADGLVYTFALRSGVTSYVLGIRQVSIVGGVALGWRYLKEPLSPPRLVGVSCIVLGCLLLSIASARVG